MKKKGFTLIELLAVIVILSIIALIAVPIVLKVIENSKKGATKASAISYIKAVEAYAMSDELEKGSSELIVGENYVATLNELLEIKGTKPTSGVVILDSGNNVTEANLYYEGYSVSYNGDDYTIEKGESNTPVVTGPTKVTANSTDTHKGIVYLDPTDLNKTCNASNSVSTTGTKTGCMKWYIYNDSGSNYKMILDHNTTARIQWNAAGEHGINVELSSSNLQSELAYLSSTSGSKWKVTADLISVQDILNIVGGVSTFNVSDDKSWFYLDGTGDKKQTMSSYDASNRNKYAWLYDYTYKCKSDNNTDIGCNYEDNFANYETVGTLKKGPIYGYWTKNPVGTAGSGELVWLMGSWGNLHHNYAINEERGIRPVISIPKTVIKSLD